MRGREAEKQCGGDGEGCEWTDHGRERGKRSGGEWGGFTQTIRLGNPSRIWDALAVSGNNRQEIQHGPLGI